MVPQRHPLQLPQQVRSDVLIGHASEQGRDAINLLVTRDGATNDFTRASYALEDCCVPGNLHGRAASDRGDIRNREAFTGQCHWHACIPPVL